MLYTILLVLMLNAIFKEVESTCDILGTPGCLIDGDCKTRRAINRMLKYANKSEIGGSTTLTGEKCEEIRNSLKGTEEAPSKTPAKKEETIEDKGEAVEPPRAEKGEGGEKKDDKPSGGTEEAPSETPDKKETPKEDDAKPDDSDCDRQHQFLNYVKADNNLYCVINRPEDANLNGRCIKASKLWDTLTKLTVADRLSGGRWDLNPQWLSHYKYKMIDDPKKDANSFGQLYTANLESEIAVLAPGLSVDELEDAGENVKIPRNPAGKFLGPYSICEIFLINSIFKLVDRSATETCPSVEAKCANYSPKKKNGIFYNVNYKRGVATGCYIRRKSADKKCLSIDKVVGILQNYGKVTNHNEDKCQYSRYRRFTWYDGQFSGFHDMAVSNVLNALSTYKKILGLKENEDRTIELKGGSVNVGNVALCTIASMHIPLGDNFRDFTAC